MQKVDIAIAGSGIACTATLIEVFRKLINDAPGPKISITVFEKSHEFWYGIPYGSRSSVNALTITSVYDFFTAEKERDQFFAWFKENKLALLDHYTANGGLTAKQWLERNGEALHNEDFKNVYLPRYWCGRYTQSKFDSLLATVEERGLAHLETIRAEVIDVSPKGNEYEISYELPDKNVLKLNAAKVVIATGSAPVRDVVLPEENKAVTLINDLYSPRVDENIKKIIEALEATPNAADRNMLMIGTNASSIEFMYLLSGLPEVAGKINKLVAVSRSGLFPYHIVDKTLDNYPTESLDKLKIKGNYDVKELVAAAMADLKIAVKDGVIVPYIDKLIGFTMELLQPLDEDAKKQFLGIYGMQLSNQFRRSGGDYKGGEAFLLEMEKLTMLKGGFDSIEPAINGGVLHYTDTDNQQQETYNATFKVVINCTGANDLDQSSSRVIYNLVHNGIAKMNLSGKGFYVNEKFEAAPNLYVMGPLLGGNKNDRIHFWHLENASRIMYLAPYLAEELVPPAS
jgi:uncharacterized NAD(P)/FAD-binding protein YdhS